VAVGVISHLVNPEVEQVRWLAEEAEGGGASWLGLADAFWWRDVWVLLAEAARVTTRLALGPAMTNPYLRHPFHTVSALATLAELAGPRVFLGVAAGGSELSGAAGVSRRDAPRRVADLVALVRRVADGEPLNPASGRRLDVALPPVPVTLAARGDRLLRVGGQVADRVLLWAVPDSDLQRSVGLVRSGGSRAQLEWAPLVDHGPDVAAQLDVLACYGVMNAGAELRSRWGLDDARVSEIRAALVAGASAAARALVPDVVVDDLVYRDPDPVRLGARGRALGMSSVAVPAFTVESVSERVAWARAVEAELGAGSG
jgi:alkanesulfonate monooxygenase SsuD/methylene tetrahydromethanopterin reductase-like flavin-dependent oxidoreductase (luciferase family)